MATQEASALRGNQFNPMLAGVPSQLTAVPEMMAPSAAERERIARLEKLLAPIARRAALAASVRALVSSEPSPALVPH
jgi:hypothetical protein